MDGEVIDGGELNGEEHPSDKNPEQPNDPEEAPAPAFSKKNWKPPNGMVSRPDGGKDPGSRRNGRESDLENPNGPTTRS